MRRSDESDTPHKNTRFIARVNLNVWIMLDDRLFLLHRPSHPSVITAAYIATTLPSSARGSMATDGESVSEPGQPIHGRGQLYPIDMLVDRELSIGVQPHLFMQPNLTAWTQVQPRAAREVGRFMRLPTIVCCAHPEVRLQSEIELPGDRIGSPSMDL